MFKRKLSALQYHKTDINVKDEKQWRSLVVWLEDQKIRLYKIEDRTALRDISSTKWNKALNRYLDDLACESEREDRNAICDFLLGCAVRHEYGEDVDKYKSMQAESEDEGQLSNDPFSHIDVNSAAFKVGLLSMCQLLKIPPHYDPVTTLQAVSLLIKDRLTAETQDVEMGEGEDFEIQGYELGFETKDEILNTASRILRLLHLQELRELQTKINEAIVSVQTLTANPKTDQRLGKVGRF